MAVDPAYSGTPLTSFERAVVGQHRPALRQDRLAFAWDDHRDRMPTPRDVLPLTTVSPSD
jgi:hypothetical protein